jgi:hypothetical protein
MRNFELKDLQDKEYASKEKMALELGVLRRDLQMYKERSESAMDLEKIGIQKGTNEAETLKQTKMVADLVNIYFFLF